MSKPSKLDHKITPIIELPPIPEIGDGGFSTPIPHRMLTDRRGEKAPIIDVAKTAQHFFGDFMEESRLKKLIEDSKEIQHSERKIELEQLRIGGYLTQIKASVLDACIAKYGDNLEAKHKAARTVYEYFEAVYNKSERTCRSYMSAHDFFGHRPDLLEGLRITEITNLTKLGALTDEELNEFAAAKQEGKDAFNKLFAHYKELRGQARDVEISKDTLQEENNKAHAKVDELKDELYGLRKTIEKLQSDRDHAVAEYDQMQVRLMKERSRANDAEDDVADREKEISELSEKLASGPQDIIVIQKEIVEIIPEGYQSAQDAIRQKEEIIEVLSKKVERLQSKVKAEQLASDLITVTARVEQMLSEYLALTGNTPLPEPLANLFSQIEERLHVLQPRRPQQPLQLSSPE